MADTITLTSSVTNLYKAFALSTTNQLASSDPTLHGLDLYGSKYGRAFTPTNVSISYTRYPLIRVWAKPLASATSWGSVTYYDPNTVPVNKTPGKNHLPITSMPSWLSTLVVPNI